MAVDGTMVMVVMQGDDFFPDGPSMRVTGKVEEKVEEEGGARKDKKEENVRRKGRRERKRREGR
eukprot:5840441-Pyramimonas_sp.AAC.1